MTPRQPRSLQLLFVDDRFADQIERELDPVLQPAPRVHGGDVDAELDDRTGHLRADAGEDRLRSEQADRCGRLDEVVGDLGVDDRHPRDVDDDAPRLLFDDPEEHGLHDLLGARAVDRADQRQEQHTVVHADDRRRQLPQRRLVALDRLELAAMYVSMAIVTSKNTILCLPGTPRWPPGATARCGASRATG